MGEKCGKNEDAHTFRKSCIRAEFAFAQITRAYWSRCTRLCSPIAYAVDVNILCIFSFEKLSKYQKKCIN